MPLSILQCTTAGSRRQIRPLLSPRTPTRDAAAPLRPAASHGVQLEQVVQLGQSVLPFCRASAIIGRERNGANS